MYCTQIQFLVMFFHVLRPYHGRKHHVKGVYLPCCGDFEVGKKKKKSSFPSFYKTPTVYLYIISYIIYQIITTIIHAHPTEKSKPKPTHSPTLTLTLSLREREREREREKPNGQIPYVTRNKQ